MGRHVTKSIYVPGDREGKGVVAIAFDPAVPAQKALLEKLSTLSSAGLRALLGITDWDSLEAIYGTGAKSSALRERLLAIAEREPQRLEAAAREGIRATPSGTEDSPARVQNHIREFVEPNVAGPWRVLDPFAGTCNFPLAAMASAPARGRRGDGHRAWYCERDAVARSWARLKIDIASRSGEARELLNEQLRELAQVAPSLLWRAAREAAATAGPRIAAMEAALDVLTEEMRGSVKPPRSRLVMPEPLRATLVGARRLADELIAESPLLGRCLELSVAAAAARSARTAMRQSSARASSDLWGFDDHVASALGDLAMPWLGPVDPASAPALLCDDARDLAQFPDLGVNVMLTSLSAFAVAEPVDPGQRVEHWMLRLPDPSGKGRGLGAHLRGRLASLYERPDESGSGRDPRSLTAAELRAFIDDGTLPGDATYFRRRRGRWRALASTLEQLRGLSSTIEEDVALYTRTGTALLRYVATVGDVFGALFESREGGEGVALLEVPGSQVRDLEIDMPSIVDEQLRSYGLEPLAARRVIESGSSGTGRGSSGRATRTELLAYRF